MRLQHHSYRNAPLLPTLGTLTLVTAGLLVALPARSHSRHDALFIALEYNAASMQITSSNVMPSVPCYEDSPGLRPKLGIGNYTGAVYSYRGGAAKSPFTIIDDITAGRGAGNSKLLNDQNPSCVSTQVTGIDCSQYVSAAWRVPRFGTSTLASSGSALRIDEDCLECIKEADAFNDAGSHVILFSEPPFPEPGPTFGWFLSHEAFGGGRCVSQLHVYDDDLGRGYLPWVAKALKDDPASQIARFDVDGSSGSPIIRWSTLIEDRTASFAVYRSISPRGPFGRVSPEIPARGNASSGADYEYVDAGLSEWPAYYQLVETELTGRQIRHGTRSLIETGSQSRGVSP